MNKVIDAITSTEALAAFLGAFSAFLLEALRRWQSDRSANLLAGKEAILALAQRYSFAKAAHNQLFIEQRESFRKKHKRDPNYAELLPLEGAPEVLVKLPADRMGFLVGTYDPDLLNRVLAADHHFQILMKLLAQRNEAHIEWQKASYAYVSTRPLGGPPATFEDVESGSGLDLSMRLRRMTEGLDSNLPTCATALKSIADQLTKVLSFEFPASAVTGLGTDTIRDVSIAPTDIKPPVSRKVVRWVFRMLRKDIRSFISSKPAQPAIPAPGDPK